ncbi:hypothetical protein TWF694_002119 [Orbilia ellipsospora]|uniref:DUF7907 domain-containing protein n=1 Tax=Orbilia ellipsospora TaxID=2528407 RepID=A0AAV9X4L1_9PEZI
MKFLVTLTTALLCLTSAVSAIKNTTREFHLKTKVIKSTHQTAKFNNLYLYSYHTGAGLSDACFDTQPISNGNGIAFYNRTGTTVIFQLSDDFPWGLSLTYDAMYNQWASVTINGGEGQNEWKFNGSGLVSTNEQWGGWMVCDWAHGVPQLFWRMSYYLSGSLPSSCGTVQLIPEYI